MLNLLVWLIGIGVASFTVTIAGEIIATNLPPDSRFRQWWRKHVIGDDIYGDDF